MTVRSVYTDGYTGMNVGEALKVSYKKHYHSIWNTFVH